MQNICRESKISSLVVREESAVILIVMTVSPKYIYILSLNENNEETIFSLWCTIQ